MKTTIETKIAELNQEIADINAELHSDKELSDNQIERLMEIRREARAEIENIRNLYNATTELNIAETDLTDEDREELKNQGYKYIVATCEIDLADLQTYYVNDFPVKTFKGAIENLCRKVRCDYHHADKPWAIKDIDGRILVSGKNFRDLCEYLDDNDPDNFDETFNLLPEVAAIEAETDLAAENTVAANFDKFNFDIHRFASPDDKLIELAKEVAASMNAQAPTGWAVAFDTISSEYRIQTPETVNYIETITAGDYLNPKEFFEQFKTGDKSPEEIFLDDRYRELAELEEIREELARDYPAETERLKLLDEQINEVKRDIVQTEFDKRDTVLQACKNGLVDDDGEPWF